MHENRANTVSRRSFMVGTLATAIGALGYAAAPHALASEAASGSSTGASGSGSADASAGATISNQISIPSEFTTFSCDVLVIGAGCAGTEAAIAARESGASVIMVDKKKFAKCGDSGLHSSGRMVSSEFEIDGDSPETHLAEAVSDGRWIVDQPLGLAVTQASHDQKILMKDENRGNLHWRHWETGEPLISKCIDKPRLWEGYKLYNQAYEALRLGVKVMEYCMVTSLLTGDDGSVVGATALDYHTGEFYVFRAPSVVMAAGGDCQLFGAGGAIAQHSGGAYGLTGDGLAMAARVGAEFRDLEFRSTEIGGPLEPNPIMNFDAVGPYVIYSPLGVPVLDKNGDSLFEGVPEEELTERRVAIEVQKMVDEGRAGEHGGYFAPVQYDSWWVGADGGELEVGIEPWGIYIEDWRALARQWEQQGMDLTSIEQGVNFTYMYGGIVGNEKAESTVPGLYATGEISFHCGADYEVFRVFSSCYVTGNWAGTNGAARAQEIGVPSISWDQVASEYSRVYGLLYAKPDNPVSVKEVRDHIQDAAFLGCGLIRSESKCENALAQLDKIEAEELPSIYVRNKSKICNTEWWEALEAGFMVIPARMDTLAAQARTESRGVHLRAEYPEMDNDNWLKNVYISMNSDGTFNVETRDVIGGLVDLPTGKVDMGGGVYEC